MTKKEILDVLANQTGLTKANVEKVYNSLIELLVDEVSKGDVRLDGFGTFKLSSRAARVAKNPRTGEVVQVPAKKTVTFKPASNIKEKL